MKTKEELNALKEEVEALNKKLHVLSVEELKPVNGGTFSSPYFVYTIKKGDSLSVIAAIYDTSVDILCKLNNIKYPDVIYPGNKILIPYKE